MASWKRDAASGFVVLVPLLVTLWVVLWIYNAVATVPVPTQAIWAVVFGGDGEIAESVGVIITTALFCGSVILVGSMMRTTLGRLVDETIDDLINRLPGLRIVYNASKTAAGTAFADGTVSETPVKLELWEGMRLTAFKTGNRTTDGREIVFVPTSPNVTSGLLVDVDPGDIIETDEDAEDALARVLSAGFGDADHSMGGNYADARGTGASQDS